MDVGCAFTSFFQSLFTSEAVGEMERCLQMVESEVSPEMNEKLIKEFSMEEITVALNQMAPLKAPSLDGFVLFLPKKMDDCGYGG